MNAPSSGDMLTANDRLSWRRLQLSKAKLKATSRTSALLSGFAIVAMVELQFDKDLPKWLLVTFSSAAALLVAVHMMALMISTCILPNLETVSGYVDYRSIRESPHEKMHCYIEMAWIFSTGLGILLFLVVVVLQTWVKFYNISQPAAIAATAIVTPVLIVFVVFALAFYHQLTLHKFQHAAKAVEEIKDEWRAFHADQEDDDTSVVKIV